MSNPAILLASIRELGGDIEVLGPDRLRVRAPAPLPDPIRMALRRGKPEILSFLQGLHSEAAATLANGLFEEIHTGLVRLDPDYPPGDFDMTTWRSVVQNAHALKKEWGAQGLALGWSVTDLFGAHRTCPCARVDAAGLVRFLHRGTLVALDETTAVLRTRNGGSLRFRREPHPEAVPIWNLEFGTFEPITRSSRRES